jgi:hypothetical protein
VLALDEVGDEDLENKIILEGELENRSSQSKIRLNDPRDKSNFSLRVIDKPRYEGLKSIWQSKGKPETPIDDKQNFSERVNSKLLPLQLEVISLRNGIILLKNKLSELHSNEILVEKTVIHKRARNKRRKSENENKAHIEN